MCVRDGGNASFVLGCGFRVLKATSIPIVNLLASPMTPYYYC